MDDRAQDRKPTAPKAVRELLWTVGRNFPGGVCSQCDGSDAVPTLLADPEAKTAYDRLAAGKFRQHNCADHRTRLPSSGPESFTVRICKLVGKGVQPKDAVELIVQGGAVAY